MQLVTYDEMVKFLENRKSVMKVSNVTIMTWYSDRRLLFTKYERPWCKVLGIDLWAVFGNLRNLRFPLEIINLPLLTLFGGDVEIDISLKPLKEVASLIGSPYSALNKLPPFLEIIHLSGRYLISFDSINVFTGERLETKSCEGYAQVIKYVGNNFEGW